MRSREARIRDAEARAKTFVREAIAPLSVSEFMVFQLPRRSGVVSLQQFTADVAHCFYVRECIKDRIDDLTHGGL